MSYKFTKGADDLEAQAGSSRSGGPPRKSTLAGVLNPQNCPRCGQRFPSKIEESAMRKTRAKDPDEWEKLRREISSKVCTCLGVVKTKSRRHSNSSARPTSDSSRDLTFPTWLREGPRTSRRPGVGTSGYRATKSTHGVPITRNRSRQKTVVSKPSR